MIELFENVPQKTKDIAETAWGLAISQNNPMDAAKFLDNVVNYYDNILSDEEIEFLHFYFNLKMEMMKE